MKFLLQSARLAAQIALYCIGFPAYASPAESPAFIETQTARTPITVEIADTPMAQEKGLMYRQSLAADHGMLFLFEGPPHEMAMWMKNTPLSLDMFFLRPGGVIGRIAPKTVPYSEAIITSEGPVSAVLEMPAGTAERLHVKPGDKILQERLP